MSPWDCDGFIEYLWHWNEEHADPESRNWRLANSVLRQFPDFPEEQSSGKDPWVCYSGSDGEVHYSFNAGLSFEPTNGFEGYRTDEGTLLVPDFSTTHIAFRGHVGRWAGVLLELYMDRSVITISPWLQITDQEDCSATDIKAGIDAVRRHSGIEDLEQLLTEMGLRHTGYEGDLEYVMRQQGGTD